MRNRVLFSLLACAAAFGIYFVLAHQPSRQQTRGSLVDQGSPSSFNAVIPTQIASAHRPSTTNLPEASPDLSPAASAAPLIGSEQPPTGDPDVVAPIMLERMRTEIRQYRSMFGGNPVGTNEEITKALHGDNPKQINFLQADGNQINGQGELADPWGTPYFFHQLSGTEMEIRSAGPDKRLWTDDDLVVK